jgi:hypothetical protein
MATRRILTSWLQGPFVVAALVFAMVASAEVRGGSRVAVERSLDGVDPVLVLVDVKPVHWSKFADAPKAVRDVANKAVPNSPDRPMAEPGAPYNSTDARTNAFPNTRFVMGGRAERVAFIVFQEGGFVPRQRIIVFRMDGDSVAASCDYVLAKWPRDWPSLRQILRSGGYKAFAECGNHHGQAG